MGRGDARGKYGMGILGGWWRRKEEGAGKRTKGKAPVGVGVADVTKVVAVLLLLLVTATDTHDPSFSKKTYGLAGLATAAASTGAP